MCVCVCVCVWRGEGRSARETILQHTGSSAGDKSHRKTLTVRAEGGSSVKSFVL